ncbi:DNA adenine methylase [Alloprevotella tannerae]|uniref:DNA adenine methylase n=1 Tax=Alloprevotella tannerae TaxID=76122 RepID=UPI0028F0B06F|nr:DNA adenine methylase [Alloprevotella tannerae]
MKKYAKAPLPFQGQKRFFLRDFAKVVSLYPADTTFVDLFGGSGLLSHTAKYARPTARVIYNDFDNYAARLAAIPQTNKIRAEIGSILKDCQPKKRIPDEQRSQILEIIKRDEAAGNFIDYKTLSGIIMYSVKFATCYDDLQKNVFYCNTKCDYPISAEGYLEGVERVSEDYKTLAARFVDDKSAVFVCDPPYLSTDCKSYESYWKLTDYLDVVSLFENRHFIYFTSNKSQIVELFGALEKFGTRNPFAQCEKVARKMVLTAEGRGYEDQMFYTLPNWR